MFQHTDSYIYIVLHSLQHTHLRCKVFEKDYEEANL